MRILGIDPGLRTTGYGVIEVQGPKLRYLASGTLRSGDGSLPERLRVLHDGLVRLIAEHRPERAAIEQVFVNTNPQSTLLLGQARGVLLCAMALQQLPISEYTPNLIKQSVAGSGRAHKAEVQAMVIRLLALTSSPSTDAADALACAICEAHHSTLVTRIGLVAGQTTASTAQPAGRRKSSRSAWTSALAQRS